jgi:molybdenum cofactor cytidylyltransferase
MGRPKLALPVAGKTVLEQVIAVLFEAGVRPVLVVLGPHVAELSEPARSGGADVLLLPWPTPDMRATIERGLAWLEESLQPGDEDDWLLLPGDHPTVEVVVIHQLMAARQANPGRSIFIPTYQGKRGHPTLIRWRHVSGIRAHPPGEGLNTYLRLHADQMLEVSVESRSVVEDLDTPEDYERVLQHDPRRNEPRTQ